MMVDVTVIIPVFNRKTIVLDALESIASQTHLPRQVIVVDDESTDGSADAVADWIQQRGRQIFDQPERRLRIFRQPKQSAAAARQYGLEASEPSEFVAFLDSCLLYTSPSPRDS